MTLWEAMNAARREEIGKWRGLGDGECGDDVAGNVSRTPEVGSGRKWQQVYAPFMSDGLELEGQPRVSSASTRAQLIVTSVRLASLNTGIGISM